MTPLTIVGALCIMIGIMLIAVGKFKPKDDKSPIPLTDLEEQTHVEGDEKEFDGIDEGVEGGAVGTSSRKGYMPVKMKNKEAMDRGEQDLVDEDRGDRGVGEDINERGQDLLSRQNDDEIGCEPEETHHLA